MTSEPWAIEVSVGALEATKQLLVQDGNHGASRPVGDEILGGAARGVSHIRAADISPDGCINFAGSQQLAGSAYTRIRKGRAQAGDTLLTHKGTVGLVARVPVGADDFLCSPQTTFWRSLDTDLVDPGFLFYFLRSPIFQDQLRRRMHETDMAPYVSLTAQRKLVLLLPQAAEQRRIAAVLEAVDAKIDHQSHIENRSTELLKLLYRGLQGEREWPTARLGDCFQVIMGQSPKGSSYSGESASGLPLVQGMAAFGRRFPVSQVFTSSPTKLAFPGDVLMTVRAPVGEVNIVGEELCAGRGVAAVRSEFPAYCEQVIRALETSWAAHESGTIFPAVNKKQIEAMLISAPTPQRVALFEQVARPLYDLAAEVVHQGRRLRAIRDELLPKLVSGKLRVAEGDDPNAALVAVG